MLSNQSLQRGLAILDLLDRATAPVGIRDIARAFDLSPTIVQRLTNSLVAAGYVEQVAETRRYRLGYRAMQLGGAMITEDRLSSLAARELQQLADDHQLNGYLGALRNNRVVYLHSVQSSGPVVVRVAAGSQVNPHSTALGKILLAQLPVSEAKSVLGKSPYEQFTPRTHHPVVGTLGRAGRHPPPRLRNRSRREHQRHHFVRRDHPQRGRRSGRRVERGVPCRRGGQMAGTDPACPRRGTPLLRVARVSRRRHQGVRSERRSCVTSCELSNEYLLTPPRC